jgi:hypothetical protein
MLLYERMPEDHPRRGLVRDMALERAENVAHAVTKDGDSWWVPYRVRDTGDEMPDMSAPEGTDYVDRIYGPNGIFAWAAVALRVLVHLRQDAKSDPLVIKAAHCLTWLDANQREHHVDAMMAMRSAYASEIRAVVSPTY